VRYGTAQIGIAGSNHSHLEATFVTYVGESQPHGPWTKGWTYGLFVTTQITTSVQQTTEVVALMPTALTMTVASHVPVYLDTPEMDSPVQVI